jgi:hypothetical protein
MDPVAPGTGCIAAGAGVASEDDDAAAGADAEGFVAVAAVSFFSAGSDDAGFASSPAELAEDDFDSSDDVSTDSAGFCVPPPQATSERRTSEPRETRTGRVDMGYADYVTPGGGDQPRRFEPDLPARLGRGGATLARLLRKI